MDEKEGTAVRMRVLSKEKEGNRRNRAKLDWIPRILAEGE